MEDTRIARSNRAGRLGSFMLFLFCGLFVFFIGITVSSKMTTSIALVSRIGVSLIFLLSAIILYHNEHLKKYWPVFFSFFVKTTAVGQSAVIARLIRPIACRFEIQ